MFHILYGDDSFSLHEKLDEIKRSFGNVEMLLHNTSVLEGRQLGFKQLAAACDALPFLADKRLVIVEGLLTRFEPSPERGPKKKSAKADSALDEWKSFTDYVNQMPPTTELMLLDGALSRNNKLLPLLTAKARVHVFPMLAGSDLMAWIRRRVSVTGAKATPGAIRLLAELVGGDLWTMSREVEKLALYASGRAIEENDVKLLVSRARESSIFAMVDAIIEHRPAAAVMLLHRLFDQGVSVQYALSMIARQFRLLALAANAGRCSETEMAKRLGMAPGYAMRKTMEQSRAYPIAKVTEIYSVLLEADLSIKTGRWEGESALDLLVTNLSSARDTSIWRKG